MTKLFIDLTGGLIQSAVADTEVEIVVVDYDDLGDDETVRIDGDKAYIFSGISVEVNAERTNDLFRQAKEVR